MFVKIVSTVLPMPEIAAMQIAMISASITAYSVVVGPSSDPKKDLHRLLQWFIFAALPLSRRRCPRPTPAVEPAARHVPLLTSQIPPPLVKKNALPTAPGTLPGMVFGSLVLLETSHPGSSMFERIWRRCEVMLLD